MNRARRAGCWIRTKLKLGGGCFVGGTLVILGEHECMVLPSDRTLGLETADSVPWWQRQFILTGAAAFIGGIGLAMYAAKSRDEAEDDGESVDEDDLDALLEQIRRQKLYRVKPVSFTHDDYLPIDPASGLPIVYATDEPDEGEVEFDAELDAELDAQLDAEIDRLFHGVRGVCAIDAGSRQ